MLQAVNQELRLVVGVPWIELKHILVVHSELAEDEDDPIPAPEAHKEKSNAPGSTPLQLLILS